MTGRCPVDMFIALIEWCGAISYPNNLLAPSDTSSLSLNSCVAKQIVKEIKQVFTVCFYHKSI